MTLYSVLKKINLPEFNPCVFFTTGHSQTILSQFFPYTPILKKGILHNILLSDQDSIVLVENASCAKLHYSNRDRNRIILLVHGLTGSQDSSYMQRASHYLTQYGFRVFRMNLRGCGPGFHYAKKLYHSGRSQDIQEILTWISTQHPLSSITLVGFSLGANLILKLAGELGSKHYSSSHLNIDSVIAVSPPLDLETSVKLLLHKKNKFFNDFFVKRLIQDMNLKNNIDLDLPKLSFNKIKTLLAFDELVTAPKNGFNNAKDYYKKSSSGPYVHSITLPTLILHACDDPFIGNAPFHKLPNKPHLDLLMTSRGGHLGWIGRTDECLNFRWMDRLILKWINWIDSQ